MPLSSSTSPAPPTAATTSASTSALGTAPSN
jgi:hypothetical protein